MENQRHDSLPGRDPKCTAMRVAVARGRCRNQAIARQRIPAPFERCISVTISTDTKHDAGCCQISSGLCALVLTSCPRSGFLALTHRASTRHASGKGPDQVASESRLIGLKSARTFTDCQLQRRVPRRNGDLQAGTILWRPGSNSQVSRMSLVFRVIADSARVGAEGGKCRSGSAAQSGSQLVCGDRSPRPCSTMLAKQALSGWRSWLQPMTWPGSWQNKICHFPNSPQSLPA